MCSAQQCVGAAHSVRVRRTCAGVAHVCGCGAQCAGAAFWKISLFSLVFRRGEKFKYYVHVKKKLEKKFLFFIKSNFFFRKILNLTRGKNGLCRLHTPAIEDTHRLLFFANIYGGYFLFFLFNSWVLKGTFHSRALLTLDTILDVFVEFVWHSIYLILFAKTIMYIFKCFKTL